MAGGASQAQQKAGGGRYLSASDPRLYSGSAIRLLSFAGHFPAELFPHIQHFLGDIAIGIEPDVFVDFSQSRGVFLTVNASVVEDQVHVRYDGIQLVGERGVAVGVLVLPLLCLDSS